MSRIKESEHVFIAGRTGSGKTFLAETYLASYKNVIVLDTKGFFDWSLVGDVPIFDSLKDLEKFGEGKAIYRPNIFEMTDEYYNKFFEWIYLRQNCIVYIDELMSIATSSQIPFYLKAILTRGRQRMTACWVSTQRPKTVPIICLSEATHFFIFDLQMEDDRNRIASVAGSELFEYTPTQYARMNKISKDYLFWYYNYRMDNPTLNILVRKTKGQEVKTYG